MHILQSKRVLLCVCGGIAAYKSAEIVRRLVACNATVQVAMTRAAMQFITPLTLQALSRRPVASELLSVDEDARIGHIRIAQETDAVLVAPATADLIARAAAGMADDMVTAALLATSAPVVVAPSMNTFMLHHPATARNLETLRTFGYRVVAPARGDLACGYEGEGRLPDADDLLAELAAALTPQDLDGCRVLLSTGPTCEPIDPVRHITNRSSGRMGQAIAGAAWRRGAHVTIVSGPTALLPLRGCETIPVRTAAEMNDAMKDRVTESDVVVMVAAVADYRPRRAAPQKIKKNDAEIVLELERTEDVLAGLAAARGRRLLVGFAAETENLRGNALKKLASKGLDLIVANAVGEADRGFDVETNSALLIDATGVEKQSGLVTKDELADMILDEVVRLRSVQKRAVRKA
jgi:phosphopantothenoylcysteine decarboxylase/phosphopantothenate--cysteine ligase